MLLERHIIKVKRKVSMTCYCIINDMIIFKYRKESIKSRISLLTFSYKN